MKIKSSRNFNSGDCSVYCGIVKKCCWILLISFLRFQQWSSSPWRPSLRLQQQSAKRIVFTILPPGFPA